MRKPRFWQIIRPLIAGELHHSLNVQSLASIWSVMKRTLSLLAVVGLMLAPSALAEGKSRDRDQDRERSSERLDWTSGPLAQATEQEWGNQFSPGQARDAVKEGRTVPLSRIFQTLKREYGGYQLGADLYSDESGDAVYEIDWLAEDGRKVHVTVDAQTGSVTGRRGG